MIKEQIKFNIKQYQLDKEMEKDRMSGKSTRIADKAIQTFFKKGEIDCRGLDEHPRADEYLFDRILNRLRAEHRTAIIEIDRSVLTLKLKHYNKHRNGL